MAWATRGVQGRAAATLAIVGLVSQTTPPSKAHPPFPADDPGMRWSRRLALVVLAVLAFAVCLWTSLRPNLDDGWLAIGMPNPVASIAWLVLFVALLLQVSSRIRAFAIGLIFLLFWPAPAYASLGVMSLYGQFVMQPTTATVTDSDPPREGGPAPVTFAFDDGRSERGVSLLSERFGSTREYVAPREGSTVDVLRDPNGWLPPRTTHEGEGSGGGTVRALLLALPGVLGMVGVAAAASSALTRRESFIMVAGRPEPAPEARPQVATDRR